MAPPGGVAAGRVRLLDGDLGHEPLGSGTVPVILPGLEVDAVPRSHLLDRPTLALADTDPLGDEDRLADRVGVPCGAGARREVDDPAHDPRGRRWRGDDIDLHVPGEPRLRAGGRLELVAGDLHGDLLFGFGVPAPT